MGSSPAQTCRAKQGEKSGEKQHWKPDLHWEDRKKPSTEQPKVVSVSGKDRNRTQDSP